MYEYEFTTRVGFSQTDNKRVMTIEAIIDAFQDCSCFQSEHLGVGFDYLEPKNMVWIINSWQIEIEQYPKFYDKITVGTYPYEFKGFLGYRNFYIKDEEGKIIVKANSIWTLMDWKKMFPTKPTQKMIDEYIVEERLPMEYQARKITLPKDMIGEELEPLQIKKHHLDSNQHVNNGQYIRIASEYVPNDLTLTHLRVEYRKQAVLDDIIHPVVYKTDGKYIVALCDAELQPYAVIEIY